MTELKQVAGFLDQLLKVRDIPDESNNGLQVSGHDKIGKVGFAVDACMETFEKASARGCNLLVVHHGISWSDSFKFIRGNDFKRIHYLLSKGIGLYAVHLPLDMHERYGNNIQLCRKLGIENPQRFGRYHGFDLGFSGSIKGMERDRFLKIIEKFLNTTCTVYGFGPRKVRDVAVISGGGSMGISEAVEKGIGTLLTGDAQYHAYNLAKEGHINLIQAGHYATETLGVRALMLVVQKKFRVQVEFIEQERF